MTSPTSDPGRISPHGVPHRPVSFEQSESDSGSDFPDLSGSATQSMALTGHSPLTSLTRESAPTALSAHVEGDSSSTRESHSREPIEPFHLGVREKEKTPFYRFQADDETWHVLSIRMKTKSGTVLVSQTEEQWKKAAEKMMGLKDKYPDLDFIRGLTVDFTHQSFIFTDANQRQQAFVYSRYPNLKSYIDPMRLEIGANMGVTVEEKESVRSLKKRGIRVYNEVSRLEKMARGVGKTISWVGNLFGKKQPNPPAPILPLPPPGSSSSEPESSSPASEPESSSGEASEPES